jgi:hypothetical protein
MYFGGSILMTAGTAAAIFRYLVTVLHIRDILVMIRSADPDPGGPKLSESATVNNAWLIQSFFSFFRIVSGSETDRCQYCWGSGSGIRNKHPG